MMVIPIPWYIPDNLLNPEADKRLLIRLSSSWHFAAFCSILFMLLEIVSVSRIETYPYLPLPRRQNDAESIE